MDTSSHYWKLFEQCWETGDFGGVHLGMTHEEVRTILGEPNDMGGTSRKYRIPCIWKYGDIELFFSRETHTLTTFYWEGDQGDWISYSERGYDSKKEQDWDKQIEEDVAAGRLDHLLEEAKRQYEAGLCCPL